MNDKSLPVRDGYPYSHWCFKLLPDEYQEVEYIESTGMQYGKRMSRNK